MSELRHATLNWTSGLVFQGGAPGGPPVTLDGDSAAGPSPVVTLLLAAGACTGADVVSILDKMRAGLTACRVELRGTRREEHPRRYTAVHLDFHLAGTALDEAKAARAIELSLQKYCSVIHSLAPDITVTHALHLG